MYSNVYSKVRGLGWQEGCPSSPQPYPYPASDGTVYTAETFCKLRSGTIIGEYRLEDKLKCTAHMNICPLLSLVCINTVQCTYIQTEGAIKVGIVAVKESKQIFLNVRIFYMFCNDLDIGTKLL
jgi:hypothetical protein